MTRVLLTIAVFAALSCNAEPHVNVGKVKSPAGSAGVSPGGFAGAAGEEDRDDETEDDAGDDESGDRDERDDDP